MGALSKNTIVRVAMILDRFLRAIKMLEHNKRICGSEIEARFQREKIFVQGGLVFLEDIEKHSYCSKRQGSGP